MSVVVMMQRAYKYFDFIDNFNESTRAGLKAEAFQDLNKEERLSLLKEFRDFKQDFYFSDHDLTMCLGAAQIAGPRADAKDMSVAYSKRYF